MKNLSDGECWLLAAIAAEDPRPVELFELQGSMRKRVAVDILDLTIWLCSLEYRSYIRAIGGEYDCVYVLAPAGRELIESKLAEHGKSLAELQQWAREIAAGMGARQVC